MKIRDQKGRTDQKSGYGRVFNDNKLGALISRVQATVISNGTELERMLLARCNTIADLDQFLQKCENGTQPGGVYVCPKKALKKSTIIQNLKADNEKVIEPDLLIFEVSPKQMLCNVVELKDGDTFDTKKVIGEKEHLEHFSKDFGSQISFKTQYFMCGFNQDDKEELNIGLKGAFKLKELLTGRELCSMLKINYDEIVNLRKADGEDNLYHFVSELLDIPKVRAEIEKQLKALNQ